MSPELPELPQSEEFQQACQAVQAFVKFPDGKDASILYSLYKFGRHGKNTQSAPWNPIERRKWDLWEDVSKSGITPDQAQEQYVDYYNEIRKKYEA